MESGREVGACEGFARIRLAEAKSKDAVGATGDIGSGDCENAPWSCS